ncbi:hypothetical protein Hanom_Chr09g00867611 [Helianthus anomalus]
MYNIRIKCLLQKDNILYNRNKLTCLLEIYLIPNFNLKDTSRISVLAPLIEKQ